MSRDKSEEMSLFTRGAADQNYTEPGGHNLDSSPENEEVPSSRDRGATENEAETGLYQNADGSEAVDRREEQPTMQGRV